MVTKYRRQGKRSYNAVRQRFISPSIAVSHLTSHEDDDLPCLLNISFSSRPTLQDQKKERQTKNRSDERRQTILQPCSWHLFNTTFNGEEPLEIPPHPPWTGGRGSCAFIYINSNNPTEIDDEVVREPAGARPN